MWGGFSARASSLDMCTSHYSLHRRKHQSPRLLEVTGPTNGAIPELMVHFEDILIVSRRCVFRITAAGHGRLFDLWKEPLQLDDPAEF